MPRYPALEALSEAVVASDATPNSFELTRTQKSPPLEPEHTDLEAEEIDFDALEDEFTSYFEDDDDSERFMVRLASL